MLETENDTFEMPIMHNYKVMLLNKKNYLRAILFGNGALKIFKWKALVLCLHIQN